MILEFFVWLNKVFCLVSQRVHIRSIDISTKSVVHEVTEVLPMSVWITPRWSFNISLTRHRGGFGRPLLDADIIEVETSQGIKEWVHPSLKKSRKVLLAYFEGSMGTSKDVSSFFNRRRFSLHPTFEHVLAIVVAIGMIPSTHQEFDKLHMILSDLEHRVFHEGQAVVWT